MAKLVTSEALGRGALLLLGVLTVFFTVRRMLHGVFTVYDTGWQVHLFSPPFVVFGAWFIWMALRKKSLRESFETRPKNEDQQQDE